MSTRRGDKSPEIGFILKAGIAFGVRESVRPRSNDGRQRIAEPVALDYAPTSIRRHLAARREWRC
jgi:hypothetical protein